MIGVMYTQPIWPPPFHSTTPSCPQNQNHKGEVIFRIQVAQHLLKEEKMILTLNSNPQKRKKKKMAGHYLAAYRQRNVSLSEERQLWQQLS